mmetsp:Transcript_11407/g.21113  ORF Transcript_11407/g.21113 Transcript_11407/m.21113 type:complete len:328 (-) Transcript_11407:1052-2035(-)
MAAWRQAAENHATRIAKLLEPGLLPQASGLDAVSALRASHGLNDRHPVFNFLAAYYGIKRGKQVRRLAKYSPGANVLLEGAVLASDAEVLGNFQAWSQTPSGVICRVPSGKRASVQKALDRVIAASLNSPVLKCFGMHEWAMLYSPDGAEHPPSSDFQSLPLRVSQQVLNHTVESRGVYCTHYDAMRFFAPQAVQFSHWHLKQRDHSKENPACVHAAMDLLSIAHKLFPLVSSELVGDTLELALAARKLDVRASPYDSRQLDQSLAPIEVETVEGRRQYQKLQRELMARSQVIRGNMISAVEPLCKDQEEEPNMLQSASGNGASANH